LLQLKEADAKADMENSKVSGESLKAYKNFLPAFRKLIRVLFAKSKKNSF
jgi:hypothetical protein